MYSVRQVAALLGMNLGLIYELVRKGEIPAKRLGKRWIIPHRAFYAWLETPPAERRYATVAEAHRLTAAVLKSAIQNKLISTNPCEGIRLPRRRKQDNDERVIDRHKLITRLLPAAPDHYRAIIATAAGTGLRWGEAAGLCADALDLDPVRYE